jgi:uncharacterized protein YyaL (SSP411 family)
MATTVLRLIESQIQRYPSAFGWALCGLDFYLSTPKEIAVVGTAGDPRLQSLLRALWQTFLPNRVIALTVSEHERAERLIPFLGGRTSAVDPPTAFVCEASTCQLPVHTPEQLLPQLESHPNL